MIDCTKIKLVIWDLDDTFWQGTLSEGPIIENKRNIQLIKDLTDRGIVNTICSKNDYEHTVSKLQELGISEYFVFKSIDWTPKGQRIANLIKDMGLRPVNCLFLDDNIVNLNEAQFYSKELMIGKPSIIEELVQYTKSSQVTDPNHKRLKQYIVLEEKQKAKAEASDNLAFLYASNTQVEICRECQKEVDRIFELINRTNQLNFTKKRSSREELETILIDENYDCGYVTVKDNFGDYGIVGFFAIKDNKCVHFLFSCRTIGQGVEQWVYSTLGCPELTIIGDVVNSVEQISAPAWINQSSKNGSSCEKHDTGKIVFKGPCDLDILSSFLSSDNIIRELTYVGKKRLNSIEHHNHSVNYLLFPFLKGSEKKEFVEQCIFNDEAMFDTAMFDDDVSLVFLSTLIEPNLGLYRRKKDGFVFAFGEWMYPLTERSNWGKYIKKEIPCFDNHFTEDWLIQFSANYQYEGRIKPSEVVKNIEKVLLKISSKAKVCLILGSETPYDKNTSPSYKEREIYHKELNSMLRALASHNDRVLLLDFNNYIHSQNDFLNNINHYQRRVYYEASKKANEYIEDATGTKALEKGRLALLKSNIKAEVIEFLKKSPLLMRLTKYTIRLIKKA